MLTATQEQMEYEATTRIIGKGSFATVYLGHAVNNARLQLAIKTVHRKDLTSELLRSLKTEIEIMQRVCECPTILQLLGVRE